MRARHYIGGEWVAEGPTFESINPHDGSVVCLVHEADQTLVNRAVAAAREAFVETDWRTRPASARAAVLVELARRLEQHKGSLARLIATENGKPVRLALASDVEGAIDKLRYFAGVARTVQGTITGGLSSNLRDSRIPQPIGVCALVVPWNDPLELLARKLGPALAVGCTVVVKSSEDTPASTEAFVRLCEGLDELPSGVVNLLHGHGDPTGEALVRHPNVSKVSFTGSSQTGKRIMAAASDTLKRVSLECGGKAPSLVFNDCNFDKAVRALSDSAFLFSGQSCTAVTRIIVQTDIYGDFVAALHRRAEAMILGHPLDEATQLGPLAATRHAERARRYLQTVERDGGRILVGGRIDGCYAEPTIVVDLPADAEMAVDEVFAPIVTVFKADSEADAVRIANDTRYGLQASIWTQDVGRVHRLTNALEVGDVWVNTYYQRFPETPFGGWKESGLGFELGLAGLSEYVAYKRVLVDESPNWDGDDFFPPVPAGALSDVLPNEET